MTKELLTHKLANRVDGACHDIMAETLWGRDRQRAFFDVQIFNLFARSHCNTLLRQCYRKQEMEKKRVYEKRIREVEHGTFSPLVFTTAGGIGLTATVDYKRFTSVLLRSMTGLWEDTAHHQMQTELLSAEIHHHVSAQLPINHTVQPIPLQGHHRSVNCQRQIPNDD